MACLQAERHILAIDQENFVHSRIQELHVRVRGLEVTVTFRRLASRKLLPAWRLWQNRQQPDLDLASRAADLFKTSPSPRRDSPGIVEVKPRELKWATIQALDSLQRGSNAD